jgi:hypothetical protein
VKEPRPLPEPGLCGRCVHARVVASRRSTFIGCELAETDPRFARYPALPMVSCSGFAPRGPAGREPVGIR